MKHIATRRNLLIGAVALTAWQTLPVFALDTDFSGGIYRRAVAIASFNATTKSEIAVAQGLVANVEADLINSNLFNVTSSNIYVGADTVPDFEFWRRRKIDVLIAGRTSAILQNRVKIEFRVWDVGAGKQMTARMHFAQLDNWTPVAHLVSKTITDTLR